MKRIVGLLLLVAFLPRCASIAHGTHQDIPVSSNPTGATVAVTCGTSKQPVVATTPTTVALKRNANPCSVTVSKDGFETASLAFTRNVSGWFFANIFIGGILGMIIDGADGAIYNVSPNTANVILQRQLGNGEVAKAPAPATLAAGEGIVSDDLCPADKRLRVLPGYRVMTVKKVNRDGSVSIFQRYVKD